MEQIINFMNLHSIDMEVRADRVFALEVFTIDDVPGSEWVDITDWTYEDARHWLGY